MGKGARLFFALWVGCLSLAAGPAGASSAGPGPSSPLSFGQPVPLPVGYYDLCVREPGSCRRQAGRIPVTAGGAVHASPALFERLQAVNVAVNRSIRPIFDRTAPERRAWRTNTSAGDCKDYALGKRRLLLQAGLPSSAALVAIGRLPGGDQHAVLVVRTDMGDYVLDNLTDTVRPWRQVSISWEKVQSPTDTWTWHAL